MKSMIVNRVNFGRYVVCSYDDQGGLRVIGRCESLQQAQQALVAALYRFAGLNDLVPRKVWIEEV